MRGVEVWLWLLFWSSWDLVMLPVITKIKIPIFILYFGFF